jgi:hypothetical protein
MEPRPSRIKISGPKMCAAPLNHECSITLVIKCFHQIVQLRLQTHPKTILGHPDPGFRVRAKSGRIKPGQVYYREGALQLLLYNLCLKMIY